MEQKNPHNDLPEYTCEEIISRLDFIDTEKKLKSIKEILKEPVVALDCEWKPCQVCVLSIMQICSKKYALIIDLRTLHNSSELKSFMGTLFTNESIRKTGHAFVECDLKHLNDSYPKSGFSNIKNYLDIRDMRECITKRKVYISLKRMVNQYLHRKMSKDQQCTNWNARPLSKKQMEYAIKDVAAIMEIYEKLILGRETEMKKLVIHKYR